MQIIFAILQRIALKFVYFKTLRLQKSQDVSHLFITILPHSVSSFSFYPYLCNQKTKSPKKKDNEYIFKIIR